MAVTQKESQKKENNKENSEKNSSKHHEQLEIGANVKAQRADGSWHSANVVHLARHPHEYSLAFLLCSEWHDCGIVRRNLLCGRLPVLGLSFSDTS